VWTLGDRLRKSRLQAGLSQRDIGDFMGLSHGAIGMYEVDQRTPRLGILRLWAMRTGVPLDWLRYGDDQGFSGDPGGASAPTKWYEHALIAA
jgi:transcriptional regulator with XRE-family HTH domain